MASSAGNRAKKVPGADPSIYLLSTTKSKAATSIPKATTSQTLTQRVTESVRTTSTKIFNAVKTTISPPKKDDPPAVHEKTPSPAKPDLDQTLTVDSPSSPDKELDFGAASPISESTPGPVVIPVPPQLPLTPPTVQSNPPASPPVSPFVIFFPDLDDLDFVFDPSDPPEIIFRPPVPDTVPETKMTDFGLMPKYSKPLNRRDLNLFFQQYASWTAQQKLSDAAAKASLILAFQNEDARNWCIVNSARANDTTVTFAQF